jgi:hypothetical protein
VYEKDQFVWLFNTQRKANLSKKLMLPWEGPYLVVTVLSDVTFRIQKTARSKPRVVHADRLKPYEGPTLEPWAYKAPTSVERVNEVASSGEGVDINNVVGSSTVTGLDGEVATDSNHLGDEGSSEGLSVSKTETGGVNPERESVDSAQNKGGTDQNEMESEEKDSESNEPKQRKRVRFSKKVEIQYIPVVGKGRKYVKKRKRRGNVIFRPRKPDLPGVRHNPQRPRRMPARYR